MSRATTLLLLTAIAAPLSAEPPGLAYLFPAGGQRGAEVKVRVGGYYLHDGGPLEVLATDVSASDLKPTERIWFEGPLIRQPASQQKEDYPRDYFTTVKITSDAAPGQRIVRTWNAQGITPWLRFVVGDLPEVVEEETDGRPLPTPVALPVTVNGRIFPREDVDVWEFSAKAGESITCAAAAAEFGSGLEARLEIRDANDQVVAEGVAGLQADPLLRFTPTQDGVYRLHVFDARFSGGPNFVYRVTLTRGPWVDRVFPLGGRSGESVSLQPAGQAVPATIVFKTPDVSPGAVRIPLTIGDTRTNVVLFDVDQLPEVIETPDGLRPKIAVPAVANGRISAPGEIDAWAISAVKGTPVKLELRAARLGSPLAGAIVVKDSSGKEVGKVSEPANNAADVELEFNPPADGEYSVEISERFSSRGGPAFAYRLRATTVAPDFQLNYGAEFAAVNIGGEFKLPLNVVRVGGFKSPIKIAVEGLPPNVSVAEVVAAPNQNRVELVFKAAAEAPVQVARLRIVGKADDAGERTATYVPQTATPAGQPTVDALQLVCALPAPFKFKGKFELRYTARGASLTKSFQVERNGFVGPLEVCLADRQGRHLQGVTGPTVKIAADKDEFEYTVTLPPWMELGRTSRSNLMLTGEVKDAAGKSHKVSFVTNEQNEQLIALVSPGPLSVALERPTATVGANQEFMLPVKILRQPGLDAACKLELIVPPGLNDVVAEPVTTASGADRGELRIRLGAKPGPFVAPLTIRGTVERGGERVTAETSLEILPK